MRVMVMGLALAGFANMAGAENGNWSGLYIGAGVPFATAQEYYNTRTTPDSNEGVEGASSSAGISGFVGYGLDLGPIVVGAEYGLSAYALEEARISAGEAMVRAGWDRGAFLPYLGASKARSTATIDGEDIAAEGTTFHIGLDYATDSPLTVGGMVSLPDFRASERAGTLTATSGQEDLLGFGFSLPVVTLRASFGF